MLSYVLIAEGSSDRALLPFINQCIRKKYQKDLNPIFAIFNSIAPKPRTILDKLKAAHALYPSANLFIIHRDSDNAGHNNREDEIVQAASKIHHCTPYIPIIPTTMTEAWLLVDERAIYKAVNNPNGTIKLSLPRINAIEKIKDPKNLLFDLFRQASGLTARRRSSLDLFECRQICAKNVTAFDRLENLGSFQKFSEKINQYLSEFH